MNRIFYKCEQCLSVSEFQTRVSDGESGSLNKCNECGTLESMKEIEFSQLSPEEKKYLGFRPHLFTWIKE